MVIITDQRSDDSNKDVDDYNDMFMIIIRQITTWMIKKTMVIGLLLFLHIYHSRSAHIYNLKTTQHQTNATTISFLPSHVEIYDIKNALVRVITITSGEKREDMQLT